MLQNMIHAVGPWAPNISIWVTLNPALPWRRAQCTWRLFCMSSSHLGHPMPWRFSVTPLLFCAPKSWINPILHNGSYGCIYWSGMPDWIPTGITGPLWKLQPISLERDSLFQKLAPLHHLQLRNALPLIVFLWFSLSETSVFCVYENGG